MRATDEGTSAKEQFIEMTIPFWFSSVARAVGLSLKIGDFVSLSGLKDKFELVGIYRRRNSVRVRRIGQIDQLYIPWWHVEPWEEEAPK
ncbi:MAG: hypothetical protein ACLP5H_22970 [Desulfomonilaceae bacterium]